MPQPLSLVVTEIFVPKETVALMELVHRARSVVVTMAMIARTMHATRLPGVSMNYSTTPVVLEAFTYAMTVIRAPSTIVTPNLEIVPTNWLPDLVMMETRVLVPTTVTLQGSA